MTARFVVDFTEPREVSTVVEAVTIGEALNQAWQSLFPHRDRQHIMANDAITVSIMRAD